MNSLVWSIILVLSIIALTVIAYFVAASVDSITEYRRAKAEADAAVERLQHQHREALRHMRSRRG
ncbi:hypothetical protein [Arthrobacter sp. CJ23]|uniref:hypothetical protein n=1 Tax=Arthrobacter sp. CJ23 TaxID=2972479 RepID=UPI00215CC4D8|nr:hypothetical protein [Arthrobacter sp. CJ23]UVJ38060.1 hypothetical protein NVV90_12395 [Arthrobacter sp. CJ23]